MVNSTRFSVSTRIQWAAAPGAGRAAASATGRQWRETVQKLVCKACITHDFHADFTHRGVALRFYIWNPYDSVQRTLLKSRFFEATELECVEQWVGPGARIVEVGAAKKHIEFRNTRPRPAA